MQAISGDLAALLVSELQAGPSGFRGRVEVDEVVPVPEFIISVAGGSGNGWLTPDPALVAFDDHPGLYGAAVDIDWVYDKTVGSIGSTAAFGLAQRAVSTSEAAVPIGGDNSAVTLDNGGVHTGSISGVVLAYMADPHGWLRGAVKPGYLGTIGPSFIRIRVRQWGTGEAAGVTTHAYQPTRLDIEQSLAISAGQLSAAFANEDLPLGWGPSSVFPTNSRIRVYQWYGDAANEVRTFTGVVDRVADSRDPLTTVIACRDMMALLIDTTFSATAPQGADEAGAVRTEANGVYLNREVSYIVNDILDRWGWPSADRAVTATSYTLAEYALVDGESGAGAIIGQDRLGGLVGYDAWADELGVFHFAPSVASRSLTGAETASYTFRTGVDILSLSDSTDQYDLRTRVKVRGPLTTETLTDTWREVWRTTKIRYPVGIWHDPSDAGNIRVIDRGTRRLYKLRQSDRVVLSSVYLGGVIPNPLGVSGDPSDSTVYWVLNAPWMWGSGTASSVKKVRKSDNVVLATYTLTTDHWSSVKVSGSYIYLANLTADRVYRRNKATGAAVDSFSHTYGGATQLNPSGLMVDGATISVMWNNSGTTARFLQCAEGAPGTVTKVVKTAGTVLVGGEMDTTTHTECWGGSDGLGIVAKFTLVDVGSMTTTVSREAVDTALEDELGLLAQVEPRVHDTHSGDAAHPWVARRDTVTLDAVISLSQAYETAARRLDALAQRTRVLDAGIIGNPALQKTDIVRVEDPVTGISEDWLIDTHRTSMAAGGTWVGTLALVPAVAPTDVVADDGSAS
jgi:hypothetical protein